MRRRLQRSEDKKDMLHLLWKKKSYNIGSDAVHIGGKKKNVLEQESREEGSWERRATHMEHQIE